VGEEALAVDLLKLCKGSIFQGVQGPLEALYLGNQEVSLSRINRVFIETLCDILKIETPISWSMDYKLASGQTEKAR
jgi:hypothetical protein